MLREHAVLAASYDSQQQQHVSLCLSGTRAVILARILKWADSSDESPICWLHGPGGAGKTTIATTLAKQFASEGRLAGTFFFSRESALPDRRTTQNLVTTIAYQLAISHPNVGRKIHRVIQADPTVFSKSLQTQMESLLLAPTQPYTFPLLFGQTFWLLLELASALLPFLIFHSVFGNVTRMALQTCLTFLPTVAHLSAVYDVTRFVALGVFPKWLPMIVILDGLDECDKKDTLELIKILAGGEQNFSASIRFFITSRAEDYIQGKFRLYARRTQFIDLMDFRAHDDIRIYFQDGFSVFCAENEGYMKGVEKPWPSASELTALVEKSEGLFVYASTVLKFVGDLDSGEGVPATRLKRAMVRHDGLDGIYHQVFRDAPHSSKNDFKRLFGALLLLRYPLPIDDLAQLLCIGGASEARCLLRGCKAILRFPDDVGGRVTFFHASLHDFLLEEDRSRQNYIDPLRHHVYLLYDCFRIMVSKWESISSNLEASQPLPPNSYVFEPFRQPLELGFRYACRNWCYHLEEILTFPDGMSYLMSNLEDEIFRTPFLSCLSSLATDWFQTWAIIFGHPLWLEFELDAIISMCPVSLNLLAKIYADIDQEPGSNIIVSRLYDIRKLVEKYLRERR